MNQLWRTASRTFNVGLSYVAMLVMTAVAVGFLIAVLKGSALGYRYDIGNAALLWLIVPTIIGLLVSRRSAAGFYSGVFTAFALAAYYARIDAFHSSAWSHVIGNRIFFLVAGSLAGAMLAAVTNRVRARSGFAGALVPISLIACIEPAGQVLFAPTQSATADAITVYIGEGALGVISLVACVIIARSGPRRMVPGRVPREIGFDR